MELSGITKETQDPPGGEIVRDSEGNPIGTFRETAQRLLRIDSDDYSDKQTPEEIEAEQIKIVELAVQECLEVVLPAIPHAVEIIKGEVTEHIPQDVGGVS